MPGPDAAIEIAQAPVLEPVDQAVHADVSSAAPCPLKDRRFADAPHAFDHIEFGQPVALCFEVGLAPQIDRVRPGQAPDRLKPMIGETVRQILGRGLEAEAIMQVAMPAIGPLGLARAVAAKTWIEDIKD